MNLAADRKVAKCGKVRQIEEARHAQDKPKLAQKGASTPDDQRRVGSDRKKRRRP